METNKHTQPAGLCFFTTELRSYLRESHPDVRDEAFITERSATALREYCAAIREGANRLEATEIANAALYDGLRFSKYEMLYNLVMEWFPEVAAENRRSFCLSVLSACGAIFEGYEINDEFEATSEYQTLQYELTGFIQTYLEEHGLQ